MSDGEVGGAGTERAAAVTSSAAQPGFRGPSVATRWAVRLAALGIIGFAFLSWGLARHGHEPFPTGRLPGFDNPPVAGSEAFRSGVVVTADIDGVEREVVGEELLDHVGVSSRIVSRARLREIGQRPDGLAGITWDLVGPGSPVRRNQPLDYVAQPDTVRWVSEWLTDEFGARPGRVEIHEFVRRFDVDTAELLGEDRTFVIVLCDGDCP